MHSLQLESVCIPPKQHEIIKKTFRCLLTEVVTCLSLPSYFHVCVFCCCFFCSLIAFLGPEDPWLCPCCVGSKAQCVWQIYLLSVKVSSSFSCNLINSLRFDIYLQEVIQMVGTVLAFTRLCEGSNWLLWESKWHSCSDENLLQFKRCC